jgi:hypothetical protein
MLFLKRDLSYGCYLQSGTREALRVSSIKCALGGIIASNLAVFRSIHEAFIRLLSCSFVAKDPECALHTPCCLKP